MNPRMEIISTIKRFDQIRLDEEALAGVARIDFQRGIEAISWLLQKRYIYKHKGRYHVTELGDEYIDQVGFFSEKPKSLKRWKEEALTGLVERKSRSSKQYISKQSTMERAVLSTRSKDAPEGLRPDQAIINFENVLHLRKEVCRELGITMADYIRFNAEGRIRVCRHRGEHIGIFDRHSPGRWQHICRTCRKKIRQARRDARKRFEKDNPDSTGDCSISGDNGHPI